MERLEHLMVVQERWTEEMGRIKQRIKSGEPAKDSLTFIIVANQVHATNSLYSKHDLALAKLYFYRSARAAQYAINHYNKRMIESGLYYISAALLSDNQHLIENYSVMSTDYPFFVGFQIVNATQNILNGTLENLPENIKQIKRFCSTKTFKNLTPFVPVFEAFMNKDMIAIEQGLQELIRTHKRRNTDPIISRFLSIDTAGLCKLAWIKGYEIDLKSDLVPLELMPIKPLERYEDDEVLKMLLNVN